MSIVRFVPLMLAGEARPDDTILDTARRVGAPVGNSCGGIGVCARCVVRVLSGGENLTAITRIELKALAERHPGPANRLACQAAVLGDCEVTTSYWGWREPENRNSEFKLRRKNEELKNERPG